jgi:hypothetical protein
VRLLRKLGQACLTHETPMPPKSSVSTGGYRTSWIRLALAHDLNVFDVKP